MNSDDGGKLAAWCGLISAPKSVFNWPSWAEAPIYRESKKSAIEAGRLPFSSDLAARLEFIASLADEHDVAIEGVRVRLSAWKNRPMEDVTATFEVFSQERWVCISRIDFIPVTPHPNKLWRRFNLPPEINGSHIHKCEDNCRIGDDAFAPYGNLPNAVALNKELQSFRDICQSIEELFNITGFQAVDAPQWNWSLRL